MLILYIMDNMDFSKVGSQLFSLRCILIDFIWIVYKVSDFASCSIDVSEMAGHFYALD